MVAREQELVTLTLKLLSVFRASLYKAIRRLLKSCFLWEKDRTCDLRENVKLVVWCKT